MTENNSGRKLGYALQPVYPFPLGLKDLKTSVDSISTTTEPFVNYPIFDKSPDKCSPFLNTDGNAANDGRLTIDDILDFGLKVGEIWGDAKKTDTTNTALELQLAQQQEILARQKEEAAKQQRTTIIVSAVVLTTLLIAGAFAYYTIKRNK